MTTPSEPSFAGPGVPALGGPTGDDDLPGRADQATPFDQIAAELAADLADSTTLEIPARAGWSATYSLDVNHEDLGLWRKASADKQQPDNFNELRFACIILGNLNTGLHRHGDLIEVAGEVLTFRSPAFVRMVGANRTVDAVRRTYGRDAHIVAASRKVLEEAGYGDEARSEDPTTA